MSSQLSLQSDGPKKLIYNAHHYPHRVSEAPKATIYPIMLANLKTAILHQQGHILCLIGAQGLSLQTMLARHERRLFSLARRITPSYKHLPSLRHYIPQHELILHQVVQVSSCRCPTILTSYQNYLRVTATSLAARQNMRGDNVRPARIRDWTSECGRKR